MTTLHDGLHFVTTREVYWNLPQADRTRKEFRVPAGTRGKVAVDRNTREVGFVFDGLTHPEFGVFPTLKKPGVPALDWMQEIDRMRAVA